MMKKTVSILILVCFMMCTFMPVMAATGASPGGGGITGGTVTETVWENGYIMAVLNQSYGAEPAFLIKMFYSNGDAEEFACKARVTVNGEKVHVEELYTVIPKGVFCEFVRDAEGGIKRINTCDLNNAAAYYDVEYSEAEGGLVCGGDVVKLPVYNQYGNDIVRLPALTNEYTYDVLVCDYAVVVQKIYSKTYDYVIENTETYVDLNISNNIVVTTVDTFAPSTSKISGILKDAGGNVLEEKTDYMDYGLVFGGIPNKTADYKIEFWLTDENGTQITDKIHIDYTAEIELMYGYVLETRIETGLAANVTVVKMLMPDANTYECRPAGRIRINGTLNRDYTGAVAPLGSFCEFLLDEQGKVVCINYDDTGVFTTYADAEYKNGSFVSGDTVISQPAYYEFGDIGEIKKAPVLSEDYTYNIKVNPYAVVITSFASKTYPYVIENITVNQGTGFGGKALRVAFDGKNNNGVIYRAQLFDGDNMVADVKTPAADADGFSYLEFKNLPNEDKEYKIIAWVENAEGTQQSDKFEAGGKTEKTTIVAGTIVDLDDRRITLKLTEGINASLYFANSVRIENRIYNRYAASEKINDMLNSYPDRFFSLMLDKEECVVAILFGNNQVPYYPSATQRVCERIISAQVASGDKTVVHSFVKNNTNAPLKLNFFVAVYDEFNNFKDTEFYPLELAAYEGRIITTPFDSSIWGTVKTFVWNGSFAPLLDEIEENFN